MSAGERSRSGATTELVDEKVRKNPILTNRDKEQRSLNKSGNGKGAQVNESRDTPSNRRPARDDATDRDTSALPDSSEPSPKPDGNQPAEPSEMVDRPGFDLGGSSGRTQAGKGLGLGTNSKNNRKGWRLPR
jgi:hypothetical protein